MSASMSSVSLRAEKAAQILSIQPSDLLKILADEGISADEAGLAILDSPGTTVDDIASILTGKSVEVAMSSGLTTTKQIKAIPAKAAAGVLKDLKKELETKIIVNNSTTGSAGAIGNDSNDLTAIATIIRDSRPIEQWDDASLLKSYAETRSYETEQELDRRAKHQRFVVLKPSRYEPGKEEIDIEKTLDLLKQSRKRTIPSLIPVTGGFAVVYRVTELNMQDRIVELCPICGEALWKGYCERCQLTFEDVGDDERAYVRLIAESNSFRKDSMSDRRAILASAVKGLDDLKQTWPSLMQKFEELKLTNSLPKLRVIENRPSVTVADPYHVGGKRLFGNQSY